MAHRRIDYAGSTNPIYFGGEWQPSPTDKREQAILSAVIDNPDFLEMTDSEWDRWIEHATKQTAGSDCVTFPASGCGMWSRSERRGRPRKETDWRKTIEQRNITI